jgi:hypothetical protein
LNIAHARSKLVLAIINDLAAKVPGARPAR